MKKQFILAVALVATLPVFHSCTKDENKTATATGINIEIRIIGNLKRCSKVLLSELFI